MWYAKEKGEWDAGRAIEGAGQGMLEQGESQTAPVAQAQEQSGNGIFSSSTLAALKGYTTSSNKRAAPVAGPLVDYGSDEDSD